MLQIQFHICVQILGSAAFDNVMLETKEHNIYTLITTNYDVI